MDDQTRSEMLGISQAQQYRYEHKVRMQTLSNDYNLLILNWYFLLNSGGLIGTITLLSLKTEEFIDLCIILALVFGAGVSFIIRACILGRKRILLEFDTSAKKHDIPTTKSVNIFESLSIISFALGVVLTIAVLI
jgi:hypothetical protein